MKRSTPVLLSLALYSCAFHKEFPYICFLKGCIKQQYNLPDTRAVKKRMQANRKKRQRVAFARSRKQNKTNEKYKNKNYNSDYNAHSPIEDSVSLAKKDSAYTFINSAEDQLVKLIFERQPASSKDSLMYHFIEEKNDISDDDKNNALNYLKVTGKESVTKITIKIKLNKNEKGRHEKMYLKHRSRKLKEFLLKENITDSIIEIVAEN